MDWLHWILQNLLRNRRRTLLTLASVSLSLFLLAFFCAFYRFMIAPASSERTDLLLVVEPRASVTLEMPLAYQERIRSLPGVAASSPFAYFDGHYGSTEALVPGLGLDPRVVFTFFRDWTLAEEDRQAFLNERLGLLVSRKLAEKYGWKVGHRVHLASHSFSSLALDFVVRGIYDSKGQQTAVIFHWKYLNDALEGSNKASQFWVLARRVHPGARGSLGHRRSPR
jgi:putative ABC transport system permease protein